MRIRELSLINFGPFRKYSIPFVSDDSACLLLTGRNNEGKTSIITALRLLDAAARVINKGKQEIIRDEAYFYKFLVQDTENLLIGRMVYNYQPLTAEIHCTLSDGFRLSVFLDPSEELAYADYRGRIPSDINQIFGFIPPLGLLSEDEDIITSIPYLRANMRTSLAPRHLRNYFYQILSRDEFQLVKDIIKSSWENVELSDFAVDRMRGKINCFFKEGRIEREISWAGQGLQVWFQIITHLVRLRNSSILILDEPEINLHPEKQNDLIRIIREHYMGSIIIATHSVELMNNVSVSHIVNVQKSKSRPIIKTTDNRNYLEFVRSQIGSNFNLIASQFEDFDLIIFTEDSSDFSIIKELAAAYGIQERAFNIPLHGFNEFSKAIAFKQAYELLIGRSINYSILLDRDYYPEDYLLKTKDTLEAAGIRVLFTIGKEIENIFLSPSVLKLIIPKELKKSFDEYWEKVFNDLYLDCQGSYISQHEQFLPRRLDTKTIIKKYTPQFNSAWKDRRKRYNIVAGKVALKRIRAFYQSKYKRNLTQKLLVNSVASVEADRNKKLMMGLYHIIEPPPQKLRY
jgi:predicted ATP-dependent endonuclease of OLD family